MAAQVDFQLRVKPARLSKRALALLPTGPWRCELLKCTFRVNGRASCARSWALWNGPKRVVAKQTGYAASSCRGCPTGKEHAAGRVPE